MAAAFFPLLRGGVDVFLRSRVTPVVHLRKVGPRCSRDPPHRGRAVVLDLVARRTERYEPYEALDVCGVVVLPDLMTLDGVSSSAPVTDLTSIPRCGRDGTPDLVPCSRGHQRSDVRRPCSRRDEFNGEGWT